MIDDLKCSFWLDQSRIEDLEDKLHECLCGDLEVALGRIKELETMLKFVRVFVSSRQKIHPSGLEMLDNLIPPQDKL